MTAMKDDSILQASRYADGEMDMQEQSEFASLLTGHDELKIYVDHYQQASTVFKEQFAPDKNREALKQTISKLNKQYFKSQSDLLGTSGESKVSFKTYAGWISSIVAVLLIGFFVFNPFKQSLYDQYNTSTVMPLAGQSSWSQATLEKAAAFYNKKDFINAESLLGVAYTADPKNEFISYYYALTLIQDKQEAKARGILQTLYNGGSAFKYNAAYYIALSYVKQKSNVNAIRWLKRVPEGTSNYANAVRLLGKL